MSELNRVHSAFDTIEAPEKDKLEMIGRAIGYGRAIQILGQLWDDMLQREYPNVGRHQEGLHRRTDIERIEAGLPIARQVTYFQKRGRKGRITAIVPFDYTIENVASVVTDTPLYGRAPVSTPQQSAQHTSLENFVIRMKCLDPHPEVSAKELVESIREDAERALAKQSAQRASVDTLSEAVSVMLWLYRRLPHCYGRPSHVEVPILALAKIAEYKLSFLFESFAERGAAPSPAPQGEQA